MGNFGSKGGLRRFVPVDQEKSSDQVDLSHIFRRKKVDTEFQEFQYSPQKVLLREMIRPSHPKRKKGEVTDRSVEGLRDPTDEGVIK